MGILTGYSQEEVAALPAMGGADLLAYHNEVYESLLDHVRQLPEGDLDAPFPARGSSAATSFGIVSF
jgi:hypothetical protein